MNAHEKRCALWETKEQYLEMKAAWAEETHTPVQHILYNLLRGLPYYYGFSLGKNKNKWDNGNYEGAGFVAALNSITWTLKLENTGLYLNSAGRLKNKGNKFIEVATYEKVNETYQKSLEENDPERKFRLPIPR